MKKYATPEQLKEHFNGLEPEEYCCDFCQFPTARLNIYRQTKEHGKGCEQENSALCTICASTMCGNAHAYPSQYRGEWAVMQQISFVGNSIIEAMDSQPNYGLEKLVVEMVGALNVAHKSQAAILEESQLLALNCHNLTDKVAALLELAKSGNELKTPH